MENTRGVHYIFGRDHWGSQQLAETQESTHTLRDTTGHGANTALVRGEVERPHEV